MSNDGNRHSDSTESDNTDSGLPLSRRGVLAATGVAGLGVVGSTAVGAQDNEEDGTEESPFAVREHDHSGEYGEASRLGEEAPVESITVDTLTSARHDGIVNAGEFDTLNDAIASAQGDGPVHVVLPGGVTEFDERITNIDRDLIIEGKGKDVSTIRSAGPGTFYAQYFDRSDRTLQLRGFTLDLDHAQTSNPRVIFMNDDFGRLIVDDFKCMNINVEEQSTQRGVFQMSGDAVDLVQIDDSEFRFDTIVNRGPNKYFVFKGNLGTIIDRFIVRGSLHVGERLERTERPDFQFFNGYQPTVGQFGLVRDCEFREWDQYATMLHGPGDATIKIVNNYLDKIGDGDMIRAGPVFEDGARILIHGNTVREGLSVGDRGIIVQGMSGARAGAVTISDNIIEDEQTPISVTSGRNVLIENNTITDSGWTDVPYTGDEPSSHTGIFVRSRNAPTTNVRIAGNLLTNDDPDRRMGPAITLQHTAHDWSGLVVVENNLITGNEALRWADDPDEAISIWDEIYEQATVVERHNEVLDQDDNGED